MGPVQKKHGGRTTGSTGITPAFPAQWFTAYSALSPVTGLVCHRHFADHLRHAYRQRRGARTTLLRRPPEPRSSVVAPASTASHRNVRDDRDPPLIWVRRAESNH